MEIKETIGIDVSKLIIDVTIHSTQAYSKFDNEPKGFKSMLK
jgi:transposase